MRFFKPMIVLIVLASFSAMVPAMAAPAEDAHFSAVHHATDAHYIDFSPFGTVELPRIFLTRTAGGGLGVDVFWSTADALRSGQYSAVMEHEGGEDEVSSAHAEAASPERGPPADPAAEELIASGEHLDARLVPAGGGEILVDFSISRYLFYAFLAAVIVAVLFISLARRYERGVGRETAPKGAFQNVMETMIVFIRDEVAKPNLGDYYPKYLPYLLTIFFFILVCNLMGLVPFGMTPTANITLTAVLALFTFVITQFSGSKDYWSHVVNPPVPWWMKPIMIPVEIVGLFTKPFALCVRLFANMTAGHLVILSLIGLIFLFTNMYGAWIGGAVVPVSVAFALFIAVLELLVALIQAYIFTVLSALYFGMALEEHAHGDEPELAEGAVPKLHGEDHSTVTPHPLRTTDGAAPQHPHTRKPEPAPVAG